MRPSGTVQMAGTRKRSLVPRSLQLVGLGVALMLQWSGNCVAAVETASATAGYREASGELKASVAAPIDRVWKGTLDMVSEMEYGTTRRRKDAARAEVFALTPRRTPIEIQMKSGPAGSTRVTIRVGTTGSEKLSRILLEKITNRL